MSSASSLAPRFRATFARNRAFLEAQADSRRQPDPANTQSLIGATALGAFYNLTVIHAAGEADLFERALFTQAAWITRASDLHLGTPDLPALDRLELALAYDLGCVLSPSLFPPRPFAFSGLPDGLVEAHDGGDARTALLCVWGFYATFRDRADQHSLATHHPLLCRRRLPLEVALLASIPAFIDNVRSPRWEDVRRLLERWLPPEGPYNTSADDHHSSMRAVLVLLWCRFRLLRLDSTALLETFLGHTFDGSLGG